MDDDTDQEWKSIAPAFVQIDREGESAMRRAARFARHVPEAWQALHDDEEIQDLQGQLRTRLDAVETDLLCWNAEGRRIPENPLPCGLERWQGRLRVYPLVWHEDRSSAQLEKPRLLRQVWRNAQDFRVRVETIIRLLRAAVVETRARGAFEITEGGTAYD